MFLRRFALSAIAAAALACAWPAHAATLALNAAQAQALGVRFAAVQSANTLEIGVSARVVLRADAQYVVAAPYAGMVSQVMVTIGQTVKKGQVLASFASPQMFEATRALSEARSQSELAQLALKRDRQLLDDGIIARSRWESTQAHAREASAMLQARQAELKAAGLAVNDKGEASMVAGRAGLVAQINALPGTRVEAAAPLFRIVDANALELDLLLSRDQASLRGGEQVEVRQRGASGKVAGVVPASDGTGAQRVRVTLDQRGSLQAGDNVTATIHLVGPSSAQSASSWRVPASALAWVQGKPGVFIAMPDGVLYHQVTLDATDDAYATVRGVLPADAKVAVSGLGALKGLLAGGK